MMTTWVRWTIALGLFVLIAGGAATVATIATGTDSGQTVELSSFDDEQAAATDDHDDIGECGTYADLSYHDVDGESAGYHATQQDAVDAEVDSLRSSAASMLEGRGETLETRSQIAQAEHLGAVAYVTETDGTDGVVRSVWEAHANGDLLARAELESAPEAAEGWRVVETSVTLPREICDEYDARIEERRESERSASDG